MVQHYYLPSLELLEIKHTVTVLDRVPATISQSQKRFQSIQFVDADFRTHFEHAAPYDAVIVALPNHLHFEAVTKALTVGSAVLCEKPLAMTAGECKTLHALSQQTNKILSVNMVRRRLPGVRALLTAAQQGVVGSIQTVDWEMGEPHAWLSDTGAYFQRKNGGVLADLGVHYLDILQEIFGGLTPVSYSDDYAGGTEANCLFELKTDSGIPIRMQLSRTYKLRNTAVFSGSKGELVLDKNIDDECFVRLSANENLQGSLRPEPKAALRQNRASYLHGAFCEQLRSFIESAESQSVSGGSCTALDAARIMGLIEWAYAERIKSKPTPKNRHLPKDTSVNGTTLSPQKTLITGATGFIGEHLLSRLSSLGFTDIVAPVRNYKTCSGIARFQVKLPHVDLLDFNQVKEAMQGAKYVFHLAYGRDGARAGQVTVEGTKNVVRAALALKAEAIVILSSAYVFGFPAGKKILDESCGYAPYGGAYGKDKAVMERFCLEAAKKTTGTRIVVLNPTCVYGPNGNTFSVLPFTLAKQNSFCWIDDGAGKVNYTYIENLIDAMLLSAINIRAHGERFIISDGACTWREFLTPLIEPFQPIPSYSKAELVRLQKQSSVAWTDVARELFRNRMLMDKVRTLPGMTCIKRLIRPVLESRQPSQKKPHDEKTIAVPPVWLADLFPKTPQIFSAEKAGRVLGWQPKVTLSEGQRITKEWLNATLF